jgi:hypothetical protein
MRARIEVAFAVTVAAQLLVSIGHVSKAYVLAIAIPKVNLEVECRRPCWKRVYDRSLCVNSISISIEEGALTISTSQLFTRSILCQLLTIHPHPPCASCNMCERLICLNLPRLNSEA